MVDSFAVHPGLEALEDGFYMLDPSWRVRYWNGAAARYLRVSREQALGRPLWDVVPELRRSRLASQLQRAMAERRSIESQTPHLPGCCEGVYTVRAVPLDGGGLAVQFRDATAEVKLAERHARLLESIRDGFVAVDSDGIVVYVNRLAERLLRLRRSEALGKQVWPLIPRPAPQIEAALRATLADGEPRYLRRLRLGGAGRREHFFDVWVHPLPGGGLSVLFQDVTRLVRRERKLSRYAADAEAANHAKSRFFAAVSHELRTPLNALVGYTHLLSTETYGPLPAAAVRAAARSSICAEHLSRLVDDLLLMTTVEIDRLPVVATPIALDTFLPNALEPIRQQAEAKGLRFVVDLAASLPTVVTDPDRLRQLLNALVSNAVKFTSRGEVRVEATAPHANPTPDAALPDEHRSAEGVRIRVIDTGPGIPPDAQARIFEAFEQLGNPSRSDSLQRGTGLGLTVARHLTALLRGRLTLEASGPNGSAFRLDLPLSRE